MINIIVKPGEVAAINSGIEYLANGENYAVQGSKAYVLFSKFGTLVSGDSLTIPIPGGSIILVVFATPDYWNYEHGNIIDLTQDIDEIIAGLNLIPDFSDYYLASNSSNAIKIETKTNAFVDWSLLDYDVAKFYLITSSVGLFDVLKPDYSIVSRLLIDTDSNIVAETFANADAYGNASFNFADLLVRYVDYPTLDLSLANTSALSKYKAMFGERYTVAGDFQDLPHIGRFIPDQWRYAIHGNTRQSNAWLTERTEASIWKNANFMLNFLHENEQIATYKLHVKLYYVDGTSYAYVAHSQTAPQLYTILQYNIGYYILDIDSIATLEVYKYEITMQDEFDDFISNTFTIILDERTIHRT